MKKGGTKKRSHLEELLRSSTTPVFLLSADRKVLFFNSGCEKISGWTAGEVLGRICSYASVAAHSTVEAFACGLCPPPEVLAGTGASVVSEIVHRDGSSQTRMLHFVPLPDDEDGTFLIFGFMTPIDSSESTTTSSPSQQLHAELAILRSKFRARFAEQTLVCRGPLMAKILHQLELAKTSQASVFLQGEVGSGRDHLAHVIHYSSPNQANWFVPLDCRRLSADELKRILERLFELHWSPHAAAMQPQPGTLYLSDVEFLPRDLQERLVWAFAHRPQPAGNGLRLMSCGTRSLKEAIADESVRPDLYALLTTISIEIPPLRNRDDDLPVLAQHFLEEANRQGHKQIGGISDEVWPLFHRYAWPGNLDELHHVIREAFAQCTEPTIKIRDLPFRFRTGLAAQELPPPAAAPTLLLDPALLKVETDLIREALERSKHNKSKAADLLGVNRARLYRRMEMLGIEDREGNSAGSDVGEPQ